MSLERGRFGIEYNPRQMGGESSGLGWVFVLVALVALVSLAWTLVRRCGFSGGETSDLPPAAETAAVSQPSNNAPQAATMPSLPPVVTREEYGKRPAKVRNLLMRLEEAERRRDIEMAVSTIETIRALPGSPAADLDNALARRLGALNVRRLFDGKNAQWVRQVTVGRGGSASRIAAENGSTLASLSRLNGGKIDKVILGRKLYVMDHPRFNLVIHRRARTADLSLNGKFFRRYDLTGDVRAAEGVYALPDKKRAFWGSIGAKFAPADQAELELLMPSGAPVLISEM